MQPSARLKAVEELLAPLCAGGDFLPIHLATANYFRSRRYIGSKDRRFIQETLYAILHGWQALNLKLREVGALLTGRNLILAHLVDSKGFHQALFGEDKYGLPALTEDERALIAALPGIDVPDWARENCPEWIYPKFEERFTDKADAELAALNQRAPFTVRVNTLKPSPAEALKALGFAKGKWALLARVSDDPVPIQNHAIYRNGQVEVQDEGSQLATLLVGAEEGMQIADLCAGAGGKTLGLAAAMNNSGQIYAFDIEEKKLETLKGRMQRAGVRNIQPALIPEEGTKRAEALKPLKEKMDRVLLDVPCSGTGVWRRHPDSRLRLTPEKLETYKEAQAALLKEGAGLAKAGGILTYVTCSLLRDENEAQIERFLKDNPGWSVIGYRQGLSAKEMPESASTLEGALLLTPARHGTDGFFVAVLRKP